MSDTPAIHRRDFLKTTAAAAATLPALGVPRVSRSGLARAYTKGSDTIKIGLIGCGGRGTGAAQDALRAKGVQPKLVAMADAFEDRLRASYNGLSKEAFRKYYALRASSNVSRGAHDEWNIFRLINDKRRADSKYGTPAQIPIVFDGQPVAPPHHETTVSDGYVGKCPV